MAPWIGGTIVQPTWGAPPRSTEAHPDNPGTIGQFDILRLPVEGGGGLREKMNVLSSTTDSLIRAGRRYDAVLTYGALATGLAGVRVAKHLGIPAIVQFPGHPYRGVLHSDSRWRYVRAAAAGLLARYVVTRASALHLLYPTQLDDLHIGFLPPVTLSHDFTAVSSMLSSEPRSTTNEILFMGYPWGLKGVDLLIQAFLQVANRHPSVTLHLVGHCPDRAPFEALAAGHPRIKMTKGVPQAEAHRLIRSCLVFTLASRTEGTARVLLEASAAGRPIVASRVDGTPHLIRHEENGLLFESENVADLASQLDRVLSDEALAKRLGETARRVVQERYTELHYARAMVGLIYRAVGREPPPDDAFVAPPARDTTD